MSKAAAMETHRIVSAMSKDELRDALDGVGVREALKGIALATLLDPGLHILMTATGENVAAYYALRTFPDRGRAKKIADAYRGSTESAHELADRLGVCPTTVYQALHKHGVALRGHRNRKNGAGGAP